MSGRVRVTLSDGRRVTGFRKTLRMQARRTPPHLLPDWQLGFMLPDGISLHPDFGHQGVDGVARREHQGVDARLRGLPRQRPDALRGHGVAGAVVNALLHVTVTGKSRDWVCGQADALMRKCGWRGSLKCRLTRAAEAGPTLSGPPHPAIDRVVVLDIGGRGSTMTDGLAMRQLAMVL